MTTQSSMTKSRSLQVVSFLRLGRPLHLVGGVVFNGLGIAIAAYEGVALDWSAALWCQIAITATQLMTHYSNDYYDQDADAATISPTRWSGGSRVLPDGLLPPRSALFAALICGAVALLATVVLVAGYSISLPTLLLLLLSLFLAWSYSSPPLQLNRHGLGEIAGALLVPGLTTLIGFMVQSGKANTLPLLAVVPLVFFQFVMLLSVNFPDAAGDARVNKQTLVVLLGPSPGAKLLDSSLALAYLLLPILVWRGLPALVALAVLLTAPIAAWQVLRIRRGAATDPAQWSALAFWSIGLLLGAAIFELLAFMTLGLQG